VLGTLKVALSASVPFLVLLRKLLLLKGLLEVPVPVPWPVLGLAKMLTGVMFIKSIANDYICLLNLKDLNHVINHLTESLEVGT